jgi:Spy/CpxP family protein refolding chaperone
MRAATRVVLGSVLVVCTVAFAAAAQTTAPAPDASATKQAEVSFQFDRTGLPVPRFTLRIREDGTGRYQADQAEMPATATSMRGQAAQHIDRTINLTRGTVAKIFKAARAANYFNIECASKAKNIADTGRKTLTYTGADGSGSCTYNYSENKTIDTLTNTFLAIAYTMDEGRRLDFLHRYDRLGLDADMISLAQEVEAGRALELGTIAPTLAAIADDTALIQRVRLRAQKMLEQVAAENH